MPGDRRAEVSGPPAEAENAAAGSIAGASAKQQQVRLRNVRPQPAGKRRRIFEREMTRPGKPLGKNASIHGKRLAGAAREPKTIGKLRARTIQRTARAELEHFLRRVTQAGEHVRLLRVELTQPDGRGS